MSGKKSLLFEGTLTSYRLCQACVGLPEIQRDFEPSQSLFITQWECDHCRRWTIDDHLAYWHDKPVMERLAAI